MKEKIIAGVEFVRDTGLTNMFDTNMVQRIAFDNGYYELVTFIEEHKKEYGHLILTGEFPDGFEGISTITTTDAKGQKWQVTAPPEIIEELAAIEKSEDACVNWYLFKEDEYYWSDDGDQYRAEIDGFRVKLTAV